MTAVRVLHVDDEPDIREVVELSLGLDPDLTVRSCGSGGDALAAAAAWSPDLILLDVMMPLMDGPTTLSRLRQSPNTAAIPVVFMTARAQPRELSGAGAGERQGAGRILRSARRPGHGDRGARPHRQHRPQHRRERGDLRICRHEPACR